MNTFPPSSRLRIKQAVRCLDAGGIVAYPTEAVWGLGCDPMNRQAVLRLLQIKGRPAGKGMILVAASVDQLAPLLDPLTAGQHRLLAESWPGPVTWLIPDPDNIVPWWIRGDHSSVAVRVSAHPLVRDLCTAFGGPVVSTSANRAGQAPARTRLQVHKRLANAPDLILPGSLGQEQQPSTIRDLVTGRVVR